MHDKSFNILGITSGGPARKQRVLIRHVGPDSTSTPYLACHDDARLDRARDQTGIQTIDSYCCFHKDGTVDAVWEVHCLNNEAGLYLIRKEGTQKRHGLLRLSNSPLQHANTPTVGLPFQHNQCTALVDDIWCIVKLGPDDVEEAEEDGWGGM